MPYLLAIAPFSSFNRRYFRVGEEINSPIFKFAHIKSTSATVLSLEQTTLGHNRLNSLFPLFFREASKNKIPLASFFKICTSLAISIFPNNNQVQVERSSISTFSSKTAIILIPFTNVDIC